MRTMKKEFLTQLICVMLLTAAAFALTACGDKAGDEEQQSEPSSQTAEQKAADVSDSGDTYNEAVHGNMMIEYPAGWITEKYEYMIYVSKDGSGNPPFFFVEEIGWVESPGNFVTSQMNAFSDKYSNRVARQPEAATMEAAGMKLAGFTALYSSEDGTATITHHDYIEVIDDITYHFVCEYVSSASGGQHEDETTYFEFMHAIESFKVKGV